MATRSNIRGCVWKILICEQENVLGPYLGDYYVLEEGHGSAYCLEEAGV